MRRWLLAAIDALAHWQIALWSMVASWCRRHQAVNPYEPGHSTLQRMRALEGEMVWTEDKD